MDHTNNPQASSWVTSANTGSDFPIQSLPFSRFQVEDELHVCVGIGDSMLDLTSLSRVDGLPEDLKKTLQWTAGGDLRPLMAAGRAAATQLRHALFAALSEGAPAVLQQLLLPHLRDRAGVQLALPVKPYNFSDFYSSIHHARRVGAMVRPDDPILPNYHWMPVAYQGRTSSILPSGTAFHRPRGQVKTPQGTPEFVPSRRLDY